MPKPIILKNTTGSPIELTNIGVVIPAGGSRSVSEIPSAILRNDTFLESSIISGDIVVNDGSQDITTANGFINPDEPLSYIENDITFNPFVGGKEKIGIPRGPTANRPTFPFAGDLRVNTDIASSPVGEIYDGTQWVQLYRWDAIQSDSGTIIPNEPTEILQIFGTGGIFVTASGNTVTIDGTTAGGSAAITIKDEGINVPNTPHTSLNFLGTGVVATDGGAGTANITINPSGIVLQDESIAVPNTPHTTFNFVGTPITVTDAGGGTALISVADPALIIRDDGIDLANTPHTRLNFTGAGITATDAGSGVANINVPTPALTIKDESVSVPNTPHSTLNFVGAGATVTDGGAGTALITIAAPALTIKDESIDVPNTPHNTLNFVGSGVTVTDGGSGSAVVTIPANPVFGTELQEASDDTNSSTTSGTYQLKLTITTPSLPTGTYRIGYYIETNCDNTGGRTECRILLNTTTTLVEPSNEAEDTSDWIPFSGFAYRSLSNVNTIDLEYRNLDAGTSTVRRARLEIWRVS